MQTPQHWFLIYSKQFCPFFVIIKYNFEDTKFFKDEHLFHDGGLRWGVTVGYGVDNNTTVIWSAAEHDNDNEQYK
jgi:hypothetical protein